MAELAQGQSAAPVGIKPEGFVDALHRVRQVSAGRAGPGGGRRPRDAARPRGRPEGPGRAAERPSQRCSEAAPGGPARRWGLGALRRGSRHWELPGTCGLSVSEAFVRLSARRHPRCEGTVLSLMEWRG